MLRDMSFGGWFFWIILLAVLVLLPYFVVKWVFECYNGLFYKTANRNKKLVRAEWSRGKRLLLLHFWDKRVCSRYRIWYVCYIIYILQLILLVVVQCVNLNSFFSPDIASVLLAIIGQIFVIQLVCIIFGFLALLWLAFSVVAVVPRHYSQRKSKGGGIDHNPVGNAMIWTIFIIGLLSLIGIAVLDMIEILKGL